MTKHPLVGKKAPTLSLPNFDGETFTFTPESEGRPTALFFYPKSGSYGCTKEVCQFRDALSADEVFRSTQVQVIGVSPDPVEKQKKFVEEQKVTYPILSDEKGEGRKLYQVSKGLMGLTASSRVTFVISSDGIVQDALDSTMNFAAHSKFVHNWLKQQSVASQAQTVKGDATQKTDSTVPAASPAAPDAMAPSPAPPTDETPAPAAEEPSASDAPAPAPVSTVEETAPAEAPAAMGIESSETPAVPAPLLDPAAGAPAVPSAGGQVVA